MAKTVRTNLGQMYYIKGQTPIPNIMTINHFSSASASRVYDEDSFPIEYLYAGDDFSLGTSYYCNCYIRKMLSVQIFDIYLMDNGGNQQYIKTVTITGSADNDWQAVDFIFTPYISGLNSIYFVLRRNSADYDFPRYPKIVYQCLAVIGNILPVGNIVKIGVQTDPGTVLCINNEGIRVSSTGTYELNSGLISIDSFSIVAPPIETTDTIELQMNSIGFECREIDEQYEQGQITKQEAIDAYDGVQSRAFLNTSKTIDLNSFTLTFLNTALS